MNLEEPEKPKEPEAPPADPSVATINSNKDTVIEINTNNKGLGLFVVGGKMLTPPVVSILNCIKLAKSNKTRLSILLNSNRMVLLLHILCQMVLLVLIKGYKYLIK